MDEKIILVEILSCRDLLATDSRGTCNPYVKVKLGGDEVHKTGRLKKRSVNPEFSDKEHNSFVLDCSISKLFGSKGLLLQVKDYEFGPKLDKNEVLGTVHISAESLYECNEQEYHLECAPGKREDPGYITVRCTQISEDKRDSLKADKKGALPDLNFTPDLNFFNKTSRGLDGVSQSFDSFELQSCMYFKIYTISD